MKEHRVSVEVAVLLTFTPAVYVLVWVLWVRPRLDVLRAEALSARYRVPWRVLAFYAVCEVGAPFTGVVVGGWWLGTQVMLLKRRLAP